MQMKSTMNTCISLIYSSKFKKKMMYCNTLEELGNHVDLEILKIPDEVKQ